MRIESFQFHDRTTGWELEETKFDPFNLLVGVSGVGKTRILHALQQVQGVALGHGSGHAEWSIRFEHNEQHYNWRASTADADAPRENGDGDGPATAPHVFVAEEITSSSGGTLVRRDSDSFTFESTGLPKLRRSDSAIALLAEESSIQPIRAAFHKIVAARSNDGPIRAALPRETCDLIAKPTLKIEEARSILGWSPALMAYFLETHTPDDWHSIKARFLDIFHSVADVRVDTSDWGRGSQTMRTIDLSLLEQGTTTWVSSAMMSSGMRRTLAHLVDLSLAPPGTVILIDDFENGLGKNCLPDLVDFIVSRAPDLQFIITSHHPYVINNLPVSTWKLVQRRGSHVRVISARDIPALQRASHFEAFDRLLNLPEYEEGIA